MSAFEAIKNFSKLYSGELGQMVQVKKLKAQSIELSSVPSIPIECDGDWIGTCQAKIKILPQVIRIAVPEL